MGIHHRVLDLAHLHLDGRPIDRDGRHVLLECAVDSACNELFHRLAAAHQGHAGIDDLNRDVSAVSAFVQFDVHDSPFPVNGFRVALPQRQLQHFHYASLGHGWTKPLPTWFRAAVFRHLVAAENRKRSKTGLSQNQEGPSEVSSFSTHI